ncbi:MAG: hypothetical protein KA795_04895 [Burkholderiaceae bacterium]|nr:hypothetical protein [Burkholderiaceae bacterium]
MLERLRKLFSSRAPSVARAVPVPIDAVAAWAAGAGLDFHPRGEAGFAISGQRDGLTWRLERGAPSRHFIHGAELRGRTELGLHSNVAVLILNRHLQDALEHRAFSEFTDTLRTSADQQLPEEVRWLSMYEEVPLPEAPIGFQDMYAVLADEPRHAQDWIDASLATELMRWHEPVNEQTPLILMALRGNVYFRMEAVPLDLGVLAQASRLYPLACARAQAVLPRTVG